ncbi:MAG: hypothetical protein ABEJ79_10975 [Halolamina sp.]
MPPFPSPLSFAASLLVGGVALYVGASTVADGPNRAVGGVDHAVLTALLGAVVWAVLGWVPLLSGVLALGGWLALVKYRYPVGWLRASAIAVLAWVVGVVATAALGLLGLDVSALGVPGT